MHAALLTLRRTSARLAGVVAAIALAALAAALVLLAVGRSPLVAFGGLVEGSVGSTSNLVATLAQTTPLMLAALSFVIAFQAGIFNAGGQGQVVIGAFTAAAVGSSHSLYAVPKPIAVLVVLAAGAVGGAIWALPPILMKIGWNTNEILTSLMLSYVAELLNRYLVRGPFRDKTVQPGTNAQTKSLAPSAHFPTLVDGSHLTFLLPVGIVAAGAIWWAFRRTALGYEMTFHGKSPLAARAAGINTKKVSVVAMVLGGGLAGIAGAAVVGGVFQADTTPFPSEIGFNAILAALLVNASPLLVPIAAFFFGALAQGGLGLQIFAGISQYIANVITALVIIFVAPTALPDGVLRSVRSFKRKLRQRVSR
jgi:simple sugar transport system permease protein